MKLGNGSLISMKYKKKHSWVAANMRQFYVE